jgi:hypothetical protein
LSLGRGTPRATVRPLQAMPSMSRTTAARTLRGKSTRSRRRRFSRAKLVIPTASIAWRPTCSTTSNRLRRPLKRQPPSGKSRHDHLACHAWEIRCHTEKSCDEHSIRPIVRHSSFRDVATSTWMGFPA